MKLHVGVGSNIDPETNVPQGLDRLAEHVRIVDRSRFYETAPIGRPEQHPYWNGIVVVETHEDPVDFHTGTLREVERLQGRERGLDPYEPRTLDLDVLLAEDRFVDHRNLTLPSPEIHERDFWKRCLTDLDRDFVVLGDDEPIRLKIPDDATFNPIDEPWPSP
jgi:2-amino-4-hydroxy-6-hydroxymethyldihydropteridine diphosphokinase